jgi:ubiquinone biosynthesis protein
LIRDYMLKVMEKRIEAQLTPGRIFAWVLDMKHLVENTPRRTDMILDKLANDQLTVRLEVEHVDEVVKSLNRAANRLSLSMLIASFIIGGGFLLETLRKMKR